MGERARAGRLLHEAATLLDRHPELVQEARHTWFGGFGAGGRWMVLALACMRARPVRARSVRFHRAGWFKYGACTLLGAAAAAATWSIGWPLGVLAFVIAFYALEARLVFLFPAMIDHGSRSNRTAAALVVRAGGIVEVMSVVMPIAAIMLAGGPAGRGFVRSWLLGCAAIVVWYEQLRGQSEPCIPRFELGTRAPLVVRRECVTTPGAATTTSVLYVSDLHFGTRGTQRRIGELVRIAAREQPGLILLGGDLVDGRRGLRDLETALPALTACAPVAAIGGNHDRSAGIGRVREIVNTHGALWLEDTPYESATLVVDGSPRQFARDGRRRVLCAHDPAVFPIAKSLGYDVVFAGHLHGGQVVAFAWRGRFYPGAWVYRWNGAEFRDGDSRMFVSRGAADTLPIRWRCPREVIVCRIDSGSNASQRGASQPS